MNIINPEIARRVEYWLVHNFDDKTKQEISDLAQNDAEALVDAFYTDLSFGTGGLRGIMGVGSNRMNRYTVSWATQGLANYLKKQFGENKLVRVAIGYDSRANSKNFAEISAEVLAGNNIEAHIFQELRPTPLVSFLCRYHNCQAAIMVTASHNPPEYNGYKVYWDDGAQVLTPHDKAIIEEVKLLCDPDQVKRGEKTSSYITHVGKEIDTAYLDAIEVYRVRPGQEDTLSILYSSLHGTGSTLMQQALKRYGFSKVTLVDAQCTPDGNFPTCKRPNPEEKEALELGISQMLQEGQDIFIATDPDADRMGVVVRHNNEAIRLNGNQTACILAYFLCKHLPLTKQHAFVKTIVTTELFKKIVESAGASSFDVLTGFKYIAEKIRAWEQEENGYRYVFGAEESYGYLYGTHARDKDALISSALFAEAALWAKQQGKTVIDLLDEIYAEYGLYIEKLISIDFAEGKQGKEAMQKVMQKMRKSPPEDIAGTKITHKEALTQADVLIWKLDDKTKIVVRPSGTEPKVKIYLMLYEPSGSKEAIEKKARVYTEALDTLFHCIAT